NHMVRFVLLAGLIAAAPCHAQIATSFTLPGGLKIDMGKTILGAPAPHISTVGTDGVRKGAILLPGGISFFNGDSSTPFLFPTVPTRGRGARRRSRSRASREVRAPRVRRAPARRRCAVRAPDCWL